MAGKYYTATAQEHYLHDIASFGTAPALTSTEQSRAEGFASAWIDQVFVNYDRSGWDETAGGTVPPCIREIAAAVAGSILHRIRNVRDSYKEAEGDSAASRLWNYAKMLVELILGSETGAIATSSGLQYPLEGQGKTAIYVKRATYDAIENDRNLNSFFESVELENIGLRNALGELYAFWN